MRLITAHMKKAATVVAFFSVAVLTMGGSVAETGFNDAGITWESYDSGLARAQADGKLIYVLVHADWCPTCRAFRKAFHHQKMVELSDEMVFVIVDQDAEPELSQKLAPDGTYIPRSFILNADGVLQQQLKARRGEYQYFISVEGHRPLQKFLLRAQAKLRP